MGFKEQVEADISVFLNFEEFAEVHNLNGVDCLVVATDDSTRSHAKTAGGPRSTEGLHGDTVRLQVRTSDLPTIPVQGNNFKYDGKLFKVASCTNNNDLAYFAHRPKSVPKRRPGVGKYTWVQVVKGQGGTIAHAFLARMKSGHVGIMRRTNGNASLPIEKLNAPSTPQMLGHPSIVGFVEDRIQERFSQNMEHEVNAFLMGYRR